MGRWRRSGGIGWRALRAACMRAAFGLAVAAAGCGGTYQADPQPGGSKGPEIQTTATHGPRSNSASQMSQSTPTRGPDGGSMTTIPCGEGLACPGSGGCVSACDPASRMLTACAACDNTAFTDCTQTACTP
jgi:hypothetical protein